MKRQINGQRILVTGASSGIGRCLAEQLAGQGARLGLAARSADKLAELERTLTERGHDVLAIPADITCDTERRRLLETAAEHFGGLDVLINNAGVASFGHFGQSSEEILRTIMEVNFFAPAELVRLAIPILVEGRQPAFVNVGSMCGRRGMPAWPEYSASKFALSGLTEALRGELARFEIDILLIVPGLTRSDFSRHLLRDAGRMKFDYSAAMSPERVAGHIIRALQRNASETVVGRDARWILRFNRFFPRFVDWMVARRVRKLYEGERGALAP